MADHATTQDVPEARVPRPSWSYLAPDGVGRAAQAKRPNGECALPSSWYADDVVPSDGGRWKFGFSLVVGSWTLALHLRIRTMNRAPLS